MQQEVEFPNIRKDSNSSQNIIGSLGYSVMHTGISRQGRST